MQRRVVDYGAYERRRIRQALNPDGFYSVKAVAAHLDVSPDTVRRAIRSGELVAHKFRGQHRIQGRDFESWRRRSIVRPGERVAQRVSFAPVASYEW